MCKTIDESCVLCGISCQMHWRIVRMGKRGQTHTHTHIFCASAAMLCAIMARISRTVVRSSYHRKPQIVV